MEVIEKELCLLAENPSDFVLGFEKDRFKGYCDRWHKSKKISKVWYETEALFFPLIFHNGFYKRLQQVRDENFGFYMQALSSIDAPYVLRDILMMQIETDGGWDSILKSLKLSTTCKIHDSIWVDDVGSIMAPVALDVLISHILRYEEMSLEATRCMEQISEILQNRADGFYLSYHYTKYLLWKEPRKESFFDFVEILSGGFEDEARKYFIVDGKVKVEGLMDISDDAVGDFASTGILNIVEGKDVLLNFRTLLRFVQGDGQEKGLWGTFKMVYSYNSQSFFTNDFDFHLKHFDICNLILSQEDVVEAWKEINRMTQAGVHRLSFQYYEDQAINLRSHIEFMWAVNIQIISYLYKENARLASVIWNEFWMDGLAYARRFARYRVDYVNQYLCRLISYYYVCFVRYRHCAEERIGENSADMDELMPIFKEIENMPILVLQSVSMLLNNGMNRQDVMEGKYARFFSELFCRARELSEGQNKYEWVSHYLKRIGFVYLEENK